MFSLPEKNDKKKKLAEESFKTRKAREKLKKQFELFDAQITKEALQKKTNEIHQRISRHANHRVVLRNKSISLFDENENAAEISQRIAKIAQKIYEDTHSG